MKCYKHSENDSVSQCIDCGRGLCPECTNKFSIPICDYCNVKRAKIDRSTAVRNLLLMVFFFIIGLSYSISQEAGIAESIFMGYAFAGVPWGWSFLTMITPAMFLSLSFIGWMVYFFVKLGLSMVVGIFITPLKLYQLIFLFKNARLIHDSADISQ